jgi:hypothetical protein
MRPAIGVRSVRYVGQPLFLVECYTSPATAEGGAQLLARLGSAADDGTVKPVSCIAVPADEMCLCLVEADSAESIRQALGRMSIGHERIVGAVQVDPGPGLSGITPAHITTGGADGTTREDRITGSGR